MNWFTGSFSRKGLGPLWNFWTRLVLVGTSAFSITVHRYMSVAFYNSAYYAVYNLKRSSFFLLWKPEPEQDFFFHERVPITRVSSRGNRKVQHTTNLSNPKITRYCRTHSNTAVSRPNLLAQFATRSQTMMEKVVCATVWNQQGPKEEPHRRWPEKQKSVLWFHSWRSSHSSPSRAASQLGVQVNRACRK